MSRKSSSGGGAGAGDRCWYTVHLVQVLGIDFPHDAGMIGTEPNKFPIF